MSDVIHLTPEFQDKVQELKNTFDFVLNGEGKPEQGIYPVRVNGEVKGIRLGGALPKEKGSACFIAGTHQNEIVGWEVFSDIITKWEHPHNGAPALKTAGMDGDIYLMFGGQQERVNELFTKLLDRERATMSVEEYTDYRERFEKRDGSVANANRVRKDREKAEGYENLSNADKKLITDHDGLENAVFSKCALVLDMHSMSKESDSVLIAHSPKTMFRNKAALKDILRGVVRKWREYMGNTGAASFYSHLNVDQHGRPFAGEEKGKDQFRAVHECGGPHTDPEIWKRSVKAAEGALATLWPEQLHYFAPEEKSTPRIYGETMHFYLPGPLAEKHMPAEAIKCHEARGEEWHLLTGGEKVPDPVMRKIKEHCGSGHSELKPNRLANGALVESGAPIAYAWNKDTKAVSLLVYPGKHTGEASMFPAAGHGLDPNREESIGTVSEPLTIEYARQPEKSDWRSTTAANNNTPAQLRLPG